MNNLTDLNVFQKAVLAAIDKTAEQGQQSCLIGTGFSNCAYRAISADGNPLCCAVGHMIKDEYYSPHLNRFTTTHVDVINAISLSLGETELDTTEVDTLQHIQEVHDGLNGVYDGLNGVYDVWSFEFYQGLKDSGDFEVSEYIINHCTAKLETLTNKC